ncbi:MAG: FxsA family protein [Desulfonatronovibrionaceae bacterium]
MFGRLLLLFLLVPLAELYVLIKVGSVLGAGYTIALVVLTAVAGAWLARSEGAQAMLRVRANMEQGIMPGDDILDALLILVAGLVLLTPGFVTDAFGLLVLFKPTRRVIRRFTRQKIELWIQNKDVYYRRF